MLRGALGGAVIGAALILAHESGAMTMSPGDSIAHWFSATLPGWAPGVRLAAVAVAAAGGFVAAITIHELGHVLAGLGLGFQFSSMRVGRLQLTRPFRLSWSRSVGRGAAGMASLFPVGTARLGPRALGMLAAGPAANLTTAGVIAWLPFDKGPFSASLLFWSAIMGLMNLASFRRGTFSSDGRRILALLRDPPQAQRWLAVIALNAELNNGVAPEALSSDFLATATAVRDDSFDTISAHVMAYLSRFCQHDDAGAADALEVCLSHAGVASAGVREGLMCEAAVFQARRRGRADLAEAWRADVPAQTTIPGIRQQADAAILEARGDRAGALRTIEEVEALLRGRPDLPARELSLRLLARWKADLEQAPAVFRPRASG
jgi:hypothetical protein